TSGNRNRSAPWRYPQARRIVHAPEQDPDDEGFIDRDPPEPAGGPGRANIVDPFVPTPENRIDGRMKLRHVASDGVVHRSVPAVVDGTPELVKRFELAQAG